MFLQQSFLFAAQRRRLSCGAHDAEEVSPPLYLVLHQSVECVEVDAPVRLEGSDEGNAEAAELILCHTVCIELENKIFRELDIVRFKELEKPIAFPFLFPTFLISLFSQYLHF